MRRFVAFTALVACSAQPPGAPRRPAPPTPVPVASASTAPSAPAKRAPPSLRDVLCGQDAQCELRETVASLPVDHGGSHALVRITFLEPAPSGPDADPPCTMEQFWLVALAADGSVTRHKPFAIGCTKDLPQGSWCGLPPSVEIKHEGAVVTADWFSPAMRCASAYRSNGREIASLRTLHSLSSEQSFYRTLHFEESQTTTWDWQTLRGSLSWEVASDACPKLSRGPVPLIPGIETDKAFLDGGWQTLGMQGCATTIDASNGVALNRTKANVSLRALVSANTLFVELEPSAGEKPSKAAELQVCVAHGVPIVASYCKDNLTPECASIKLDGSVRSGDLGLDGGLRVKRAEGRLRYRIPLPSEHSALTVAYLDPLSGRSLSTSPLRPKDATSLSEAFDIAPELGRCEIRGSELMLVRRPEAL